MVLPSARSQREKQALSLAWTTWQRWTQIHGTSGGRIDTDDLRAAAMLGAAKALAQFDEGRGVKFSSYAIALIRGEMMENAREQDYLSRGQRRDLRQHERDTAEPWEQVMAADYERCTGKRWRFATSTFPVWALPPVELDAPAEGYDAEDHFQGAGPLIGFDRLPDRLAPAAEEEALRLVESGELLRAISYLPANERYVVMRYYWEDRTLREIAEEIGRSESRAFQIMLQARARLAQYLAVEVFA